MSESIIEQARDLYSQQRHNSRMRIILMSSFIMLIGILGIGFDVLFQAGYAVRIFLLPFILFALFSGIGSIRSEAASQLWEKSRSFEDDDDSNYDGLKIEIVLWTIMFIIFLPIILYPALLEQIIPRRFDVPLVRNFPLGTVLATIIGIVCTVSSLKWGTASILTSLHAEPLLIDEGTIVLQDVVKEISLAAGLPEPKIFVVKDSDPNAFAIGSEIDRSVLVVTSGLLAILSREELQGVIAHEMGHIKNNDTQLMTAVTILFGAVLLMSDWMKKGCLLGMGGGMKIPGLGIFFRAVLFIGWLLTLLFAPFIAKVVAMAISRNQEYYADAVAAELTRNPGALVSALTKIDAAEAPTYSLQQGVAHLCIVDPLGRQINEQHGFWADLFATHPPIKKRILFLNILAYGKAAQ